MSPGYLSSFITSHFLHIHWFPTEVFPRPPHIFIIPGVTDCCLSTKLLFSSFWGTETSLAVGCGHVTEFWSAEYRNDCVPLSHQGCGNLVHTTLQMSFCSDLGSLQVEKAESQDGRSPAHLSPLGRKIPTKLSLGFGTKQVRNKHLLQWITKTYRFVY